MDRRILITEDEDDEDLDHLLLHDNSEATVRDENIDSTEAIASASSSLSSSSSIVPSNSNHDTSPRETPPPPTSACLTDTTVETNKEEEDINGTNLPSHWVRPAPAVPGEFLNGSLHRVPSKSILKKTSSYGNFDLGMSSSRGGGSTGSGAGRRRRSSITTNLLVNSSSTFHRSQVFDEPPPSALSGCDVPIKITKKASFLSMTSLDSTLPQNHLRGGEGSIGLDLEDDVTLTASPPYHGISSTEDESPLPLTPCPSSEEEGRPRKNSDASLSSSSRMRRNVSFHSVDVREYDRTVGDHPGCRSGPPLSLDWSYSKKYEKSLDEFELERNSYRVNHFSQLHMNKYKRRNLLAFQWGHSEDELKEARSHTKKMQRQRSITQILQPVHMAEEAILDIRNFIKKRTKQKQVNSETSYDWSDMSNSISTRDSSHRGIVSLNPMLLSRQENGGLSSSSHTT